MDQCESRKHDLGKESESQQRFPSKNFSDLLMYLVLEGRLQLTSLPIQKHPQNLGTKIYSNTWIETTTVEAARCENRCQKQPHLEFVVDVFGSLSRF